MGKFSWGDIIVPGIGLVGDYLAADKQADADREANERNLQYQREFAQQGIRWRVEDAKAAGIHPLYALGAGGASFSPSFQAGDAGAKYRALTRFGQDVSRSVQATMTQGERVQTAQMNALNLENAKLQNNLLEHQILDLKRGWENPPMPDVRDVPLRRTSTEKGAPWSESGHLGDVGWANTPTGFAPVPAGDIHERIEDKFIPELMWAIRNHAIPSMSLGAIGSKPSLEKMRQRFPDADGVAFNPVRQEWVPQYRFKGGKWWRHQKKNFFR